MYLEKYKILSSIPKIVPVNTLTKNAFSIVVFALVDANYNFMFVDAGCKGRISERGVFTNTELYKTLEAKTLCLPQPGEKKMFHTFYWR